MSILTRAIPAGLRDDSWLSLRKMLFHACGAVREVEFDSGGQIIVTLEHELSEDTAEKVDRLIQRFAENNASKAERVVFESRRTAPSGYADITAELSDRRLIIRLGNGQYALTGVVLELMEYFDRCLRNYGLALGAKEYRYPSMIPIAAMQRVGYLASRPECLNFISHLPEDLDRIDAFADAAKMMTDRAPLDAQAESHHICAVAVCLHTFHQLQDSEIGPEPILVGAAGKCMRYETKNMRSLERLRDFTMREIICVGTASGVQSVRQACLEQAQAWLKIWELESTISTACDVFFTEEFARQAMFQKRFELKHELRVQMGQLNGSLAIGSINYHRDFISRGFGITTDGRPAHSVCFGLGLERCVYAFLTQHGLDPEHWPDDVRREWKSW